MPPGRLHRWFWDLLKRQFPVWYCNQWLAWLSRRFDRDRERAKTAQEEENLWNEERLERSLYYGQREQILTHRLLAKARKFHISLEDLPIPSGQESQYLFTASGLRVLR